MPSLKGRLGLADEIVLIDPEYFDETDDGRDGRLADADRADLGRFNQPDATVHIAQQLRQARRAHPTGGSSADDDDVADAINRQLDQ